MQPTTSFSDPTLAKKLLQRLTILTEQAGKPLRFMEVCGTHTVAIFRSGIRSLLPQGLTHLSGPGCPVCVTAEEEVALYLQLAQMPTVRLATFGDLLRIPCGKNGITLKNAQAQGANIHLVYSPHDCLALAEHYPDEEIVFLGVGFETTAPTVAATILLAQQKGLNNFSVLSSHKYVPPALDALLAESDDIPTDHRGSTAIDAFILPGHVATIIGEAPFTFIAEKYSKPAIITGFEPLDILHALVVMAEQIVHNQAHVSNAYPRAVAPQGNSKALEIMNTVFEAGGALWRGIGSIPESGMYIRPQFAQFDANKKFTITPSPIKTQTGCQCGKVLKGQIQPPQCPLFAKRCTPTNPVGPCMVSTEGSCAAYFKYQIG